MSQTKTTTHLTLDATRRWYDRHSTAIPLSITITVFLLAGVVAAIGRIASPSTPTAPVKPIILLATARPQPTPAAQVANVAGNTLPRAVVAYDAPGGTVLGAVEAGRHYGFLARSGAGWLQLDVDGSGSVWVRSADLLSAPAELADLAPTDVPAVVYVNVPAAAGVEETQEESAAMAAPAPAATPWPTAPGPQPGDAGFAASFTEPNSAARCAFVGCLAGR